MNYKFEELSFLNYEIGCQQLPNNNFWIIEGIAGSGKTYVAIQEARRLSKQGNKVLIIVFNEAIADYLREQLANSAVVYNYHAYCEHIFHDVVKYEWQLPVERANRKDYCTNFTPKLLLKALEEIKNQQKHFDYFNAIIVDEGQDFCPWWWEGIVKLAENETPDFFYFIYDASQNYQDVNVQESIKELKKIIREKTSQEFAHLSLTKNFRNSRKIASKLYEMFDIDVIELATKHLPEGDEEPEEKCFLCPLLDWTVGSLWMAEKVMTMRPK